MPFQDHTCPVVESQIILLLEYDQTALLVRQALEIAYLTNSLVSAICSGVNRILDIFVRRGFPQAESDFTTADDSFHPLTPSRDANKAPPDHVA